jgi:RNA polymerase sigma factor (sigma-70 family)
LEDNELVLRAQNGDKIAFEELVLKNQKMVYNYALRMVGDREDAFDLSQEAFMRAYKSLQFFKMESSFSTWLYRLTCNVCIDHLRKKNRMKTVSMTLVNDEGEEDFLDIPDESMSPVRAAENRELRAAILNGLSRLSADHRQVIILREINGLSYAEIAEILELNEGTVKSRISRARAELCKYLCEYRNFSGGKTSEKTGGR